MLWQQGQLIKIEFKRIFGILVGQIAVDRQNHRSRWGLELFGRRRQCSQRAEGQYAQQPEASIHAHFKFSVRTSFRTILRNCGLQRMFWNIAGMVLVG